VARSRRAHTGLVLAGAVIIAAGISVGLIEVYRLPKGSIWGVVAGSILLITVIRMLSNRKS
jgi:hypothetical protein